MDEIIYNELSEGDFYEDKLLLAEQKIESAISDSLIPGLEMLCFRGKKVLLHKVYGNKQVKPFVEELKLNSIFDVASMTKPIVTATLVMILMEKGLLSLSDRVSDYFPEFMGENKDSVSLIHLLTHTSGLPAWHNLYETSKSESEAVDTLLKLPLEVPPESKVIYSCMGYILLKLIIELICAERLDELAKEWIFKPLSMTDSCFNPDDSIKARIVPTGYCSWRGRELIAEVHDENCSAFAGIAGNAGLFSTAIDVMKYSNMLLQKGIWDNNRLLLPRTVALMTEPFFKSLPPRGMGMNMADHEFRPCGELFGPRVFGHNGFTGTSFWVDPDRDFGIVMLSNRVHLSYRETAEAYLLRRMRIHNLIISSLRSV